MNEMWKMWPVPTCNRGAAGRGEQSIQVFSEQKEEGPMEAVDNFLVG